MSPPAPGIPTWIVAINFLLFSSTRLTLPSPWFSVQTEPPPAARKRGFGPTCIDSNTLPLAASTTVKTLRSTPVTQTIPLLKIGLYEAGGIEIFCRKVFVDGSIRLSVPSLCRDPAFRACWCYRECRTDRVLCGIDANKGRLLSARRNPNAAEPRSQTGANLPRHLYGRDNLVRRRINSEHSVRIRTCHPDCIVGDKNPVSRSTNLDRRRWCHRRKRNLNLLDSRLWHIPRGLSHHGSTCC